MMQTKIYLFFSAIESYSYDILNTEATTNSQKWVCVCLIASLILVSFLHVQKITQTNKQKNPTKGVGGRFAGILLSVRLASSSIIVLYGPLPGTHRASPYTGITTPTVKHTHTNTNLSYSHKGTNKHAEWHTQQTSGKKKKKKESRCWEAHVKFQLPGEQKDEWICKKEGKQTQWGKKNIKREWYTHTASQHTHTHIHNSDSQRDDSF